MSALLLRADEISAAAASALEHGDPAKTLRLMDRRFGHPLIAPGARDFLLRARAYQLSGQNDAASRDIEAARRIAPLDPMVLAWALKGGDADYARRAATLLVADYAAPLTLRRQALGTLLDREPVVLDLRRRGLSVEGFVYWREPRPILLEIEGEVDRRRRVIGPAKGPLFGDMAQASPLLIELFEAGSTKLTFRDENGTTLAHAGPFGVSAPIREADTLPQTAGRSSLLVVVPIFEDVEATKQCIESVLAQADVDFPWRLVLVDDASPSAGIKALLRSYRGHPGVTVLTNEANFGFSVSVNRGLRLRQAHEDVLLLNADAFLPLTGLERLRRASRAEPDIGTVTPLSNNGEHCSLPKKNTNNVIDDIEVLNRLDFAAAAACREVVVDIPNGVGFCLYIKSDLIEKIGHLSDDFGRGYYEDVDFCLRARSAGFRNVCAVGLVVGHLGSRSFRADKLELVHRNLRLIDVRYPRYRADFAAFLDRDPLAQWRRRILSHLAPLAADILLIADISVPQRLLEARRRHLRLAGCTTQLMTIDRAASLVRFPDREDPEHETACFSFNESGALANYLKAISASRIDMVPSPGLPAAVQPVLAALGIPCEPLIVTVHNIAAQRIDADPLTQSEAARGCQGSGRIHSINTPTQQYAAHRLGWKGAILREAAGEPIASASWERRRLCVLLPLLAGEALSLCATIAELCGRMGVELAIFSAEISVAHLLRHSDFTCASYTSDDELAELMRVNQIKAVFLPYRTIMPEPEHDVLLWYGLPCAFFDFTGKYHAGRPKDCRLLPTWSDKSCAHSVVSWFGQLP